MIHSKIHRKKKERGMVLRTIPQIILGSDGYSGLDAFERGRVADQTRYRS